MSGIVYKVTCFITRTIDRRFELLLFNHPHVGVQIPAGTVEPGEAIDAAARREAAEESGMADLVIDRILGEADDPPPQGYTLVAFPTPVYSRPDIHSLDWAHFRTGLPVEILRSVPGFIQVRYAEPDDMNDTRYITYNITGWVPDEALTHHRIRRFYLFEARNPTPEQWQVEVDGTLFSLFWAPMDNLPSIVSPQDGWLKWLKTGS